VFMIIYLHLLLTLPMLCFAQLHTFTLPDGRTVDAEILSLHEQRGTVELRRADGKVVNVKPSIFVQTDQQKIQAWAANRSFLSDRSLQVDIEKTLVENWKEKEYQDLEYTDGSVVKELMKETRFEEVAFDLTLKNRSKMALDSLSIEYIIYYEQSETAWDKPQVEQKTERGAYQIASLQPNQSDQSQSKSVIIYDDNIAEKRWTSGGNRVGGKGDIHGIRMRIFKQIDGEIIFREFIYPDSLSATTYPWTDESL
jgi:hypothetical protein